MISIKRTDLYSVKGRITPSFFNVEKLPFIERDRLNERLSEIITLKGEQENENIDGQRNIKP